MASVGLVDRAQARLAARALLAHHAKKKGRGDLLDIGESVYVQCAFKQTPDVAKQPKRIPLARGLYDEQTADICLITKDPQEEYEALARSKKLPGRITVMSVSKLKSDFKPFEAKRQFCQSFDLFLADDRVLDVLPRLLGKSFFAAKKQPVPVKISRKGGDWASQIVKARDATYLHLGKGPCSAVRVGFTSFTADQLTDNIMLAIDGLVKHDARQGKNIQAIHVKTDSSVALPVYASVPTTEDIQLFEGVQGPAAKKESKRLKGGDGAAAADGKAAEGDAESPRKRKAGSAGAPAAAGGSENRGSPAKRSKAEKPAIKTGAKVKASKKAARKSLV